MGMPGRTDTVLVIDDEPAALRMITAALESAVISVLFASSGKAALDDAVMALRHAAVIAESEARVC